MQQWEVILQRQEDWSAEKSLDYRLSVEDTLILYREAPLHALRSAANRRRFAMHPDGEVTYLVDRNINYTNVCTINFHFCSFFRGDVYY